MAWYIDICQNLAGGSALSLTKGLALGFSHTNSSMATLGGVSARMPAAVVDWMTIPYGEWLGAKDRAPPPEWARHADRHGGTAEIEAVGLGEPQATLV